MSTCTHISLHLDKGQWASRPPEEPENTTAQIVADFHIYGCVRMYLKTTPLHLDGCSSTSVFELMQESGHPSRTTYTVAGQGRQGDSWYDLLYKRSVIHLHGCIHRPKHRANTGLGDHSVVARIDPSLQSWSDAIQVSGCTLSVAYGSPQLVKIKSGNTRRYKTAGRVYNTLCIPRRLSLLPSHRSSVNVYSYRMDALLARPEPHISSSYLPNY